MDPLLKRLRSRGPIVEDEVEKAVKEGSCGGGRVLVLQSSQGGEGLSSHVGSPSPLISQVQLVHYLRHFPETIELAERPTESKTGSTTGSCRGPRRAGSWIQGATSGSTWSGAGSGAGSGTGNGSGAESGAGLGTESGTRPEVGRVDSLRASILTMKHVASSKQHASRSKQQATRCKQQAASIKLPGARLPHDPYSLL